MQTTNSLQQTNGLAPMKSNSASNIPLSTSSGFGDIFFSSDSSLQYPLSQGFQSRQSSLSGNRLLLPNPKKFGQQERNISISQALSSLDSLNSTFRQNSLFMPGMESYDMNNARSLSIASQSLLANPLPMSLRSSSIQMLQEDEAVDKNVCCLLKKQVELKNFISSEKLQNSFRANSDFCFAAFDSSHKFIGFYYKTSPNNLISFEPKSDISDQKAVEEFEQEVKHDLNDNQMIITITAGTKFNTGHDIATHLFQQNKE